MNNLLIILLVGFITNLGFGQEKNDSIKIHWENGNLKYLEYLYTDNIEMADGKDGGVNIGCRFHFYDTNGVEVSEETFISNYGTLFTDSLDIYKDSIANQKELEYRRKYPLVYNYEELIKSADNLFFNKDYNKALEKYKKAAEIKLGEEYPKIQIKKLEETIRLKWLEQDIDTFYVNCINPTEFVLVNQYSDIKYPSSYDTTGLPKNEIENWKKIGKGEGGFWIPDSLIFASVCNSVLINSKNKIYYLKVYDNNNILRLEGEYFGYKPSKKTISYYPNGNPLWIKEYAIKIEKGIKRTYNTGTWLYYNKKGKLKKTEKWENGKLIK